MAVEAASIIPIFFFRETKRLDLRRNQAFHNASGGDKRDRTADLLNAIHVGERRKTVEKQGEFAISAGVTFQVTSAESR